MTYGTFERNIGGRFIYKNRGGYDIYRAQGMVFLRCLPRCFNIWQNQGQLEIWLLANGL